MLLFIMLANLADIDYLPGLLLGNPNYFHHGWVHSLGVAIAVGGVVGLCRKFRGGRFWPTLLVSGGVYYSHIILDYLTDDQSLPYGVMLFWPFANSYYTAGQPIFLSADKSSKAEDFFVSLFTSHNFLAALREFLIFLPILAILLWAKNRKRGHPFQFSFGTFFKGSDEARRSGS